jgi:uncharacterized membrane protein (UPF0127 family)
MKTGVLVKGSARLIESVELALDLKSRMVGLLGRNGLGLGKGIYIAPCSSIHTFFMRFPIDLFFLDRDMVVRKIVRNVLPWRMVFGGHGAWAVVEIESGWFPAGCINVGDKVCLR